MRNLFGILLLTVLSITAQGQIASASLQGEVLDQLSARVPGVKVTAQHEATGFSRSVVTGEDGGYRLDELLPGRYNVTAEKQGFRNLTAQGVLLEVNQKARLDLQLQLGVQQESVTINADVSPVQAGDATVGYRLDATAIRGLPLDGRNVISLVTLGPGAIPRQLGGFGHDVINDVQESRGAVALNPPLNGARSTANTYLLDGAMNTDLNTRSIAVIPPIESVQEFRIVSSLPSAEFAQSGGGAADIVTRSGSHSFHGNAFEFFRNYHLDARNLFDDPTLARPVFKQNQFGGSLGGRTPFRATFFFATYEGLKGEAAKTSRNIVPDAAMRNGDFRGLNTIFDPLHLDPVTGNRLPFPNNVIPASRIDPIARKFLDKFQPLPNVPSDGTFNFLDATPNENRNDNVSGRIDHEFPNHSRFFGRYTINDARNRIGTFPERRTNEDVRAQQIVLGHTFSGSAWLNEARLAFTRLKVLELPESAFAADDTRDLGINSFPSDPYNFGLPFFLVSNLNLVTDTPTRPQTQRDNLWHFSEGVTFTKGPQTWKFGFQLIRFELNYRQSQLSRGRYSFTGAFTSDPTSASPTGDPFADFLLGFPQITERSVGNAQAYLRQNSYAGYAENDWRVNARLTVNLGLRYEYFSPFSEIRNNLLNLDYSKTPAPPTLVRSGTAVDPDRNNFAPRVGLAWRPSLGFLEHRNAVLRAGYGVYFTPEIATETYNLVRNGISNESNQTDGTIAPVLTLGDGFPRTASTGFPSYFGLDQHARTPYMQQWNLGLQQELPGKVLLEISYLGSKGTKLGRSRTFNTPQHVETGENLPPRPGDLQSLRTWPQLGKLTQAQHNANSSFHSMQIKAERRFSRQLGFLASFVWSKSIDDADTVLSGLFDSVPAQDERNLNLERGLSFFDVRRRLSVGFVYDLPAPHHLHALLSHWQTSGILTMQDGTPLNPVYFFTDFANSGTLNRPDVVAGESISLPRSQRTADHWFNTNAFRDPAPFTFGNAGRDIIPGPGNVLFDFALHRRFPLREGRAFELRAESFNLFNHPNYGIPLPYPDFGPFFGKVVATGDPRRIQLALRFDF
jgi:Carboxypeptidase regulatory-like domain/TonB dependent receptor